MANITECRDLIRMAMVKDDTKRIILKRGRTQKVRVFSLLYWRRQEADERSQWVSAAEDVVKKITTRFAAFIDILKDDGFKIDSRKEPNGNFYEYRLREIPTMDNLTPVKVMKEKQIF